MFSKVLQRFLRSESGVVTVDWVVLTAATCLLGALFVMQIKQPQDAIGEQIDRSLSAGTLSDLSFH